MHTILANLTAANRAETHLPLPNAYIATAHLEIAHGCLLHVALSEHGVTVHHGDQGVTVPLKELVRLAQEAEPALLPPPPAAAKTQPA